MITLTVTSSNGSPVSNLACSFDELGGCIGRAATNKLILPDPERTISRVQAQIVFRCGRYALAGRGGNAVLVNGREVASGSEQMLADGDQIRMGSYTIAVSEHRSPAKVDPFEAMFGSGQSPASSEPLLRTSSEPWPGPIDTKSPAKPFPDLIGKALAKGVPDDWDPFEKLSHPDPFGLVTGSIGMGQTGSPGSVRLSDLGVGRTSQEDSLDALFGLDGGPSKSDPFANSSLAMATSMPNTSAGADPLRALQDEPKAGITTEPDHVSDLQMPWVDVKQAPKSRPAAETPGLSAPVFSWDSGSREGKSFGPTPSANAGAQSRRTIETADLLPAGSARKLEGLEAVSAVHSPSPNVAPASDVELLAALVEGLGTPDLRIQCLSPEVMRLLGQLLRGATKGSIELLAARASLKREVRAEVTMIASKSNNPIKFSPSVDVALQYLLGPKVNGFMPPVESMRDAFDDLRAHQLGIMAGMEAALTGVLKRFDPADLESKLAGRSSLSNLIPATRKAKLWELFQALYQQLATEAEDDFNALFGAAFLKAYEQHIDQIETLNSQG
jgi:type VI secretion system FHA domain protein